MNQKLHILVDVDDVVADFIPALCTAYNRKFASSVLPEDITGWDLKEFFPTFWWDPPLFKQEDIYSLVTPKLYENDVRPAKFARTAIKTLREQGHRVTFVTSCINSTADAKLQWLQRWGFLPAEGKHARDFIAATCKELIRGDLLVDDALHNVEKFPGQSILVSQPHNMSAGMGLFRISHIGQLPARVETLIQYGVFEGRA